MRKQAAMGFALQWSHWRLFAGGSALLLTQVCLRTLRTLISICISLLNQRRVLSRRKPSLLCLRLKSAKQGCFHPRDVLPKQSTASAGFRMAARPLGQRITGDPRGARVDRATTTGPLSPPSASNRVPAPVVDLGRALGRGEGVRGAARGGGAPPCRSLRPAGNLAACSG